jgi:hypothetical protein
MDVSVQLIVQKRSTQGRTHPAPPPPTHTHAHVQIPTDCNCSDSRCSLRASRTSSTSLTRPGCSACSPRLFNMMCFECGALQETTPPNARLASFAEHYATECPAGFVRGALRHRMPGLLRPLDGHVGSGRPRPGPGALGLEAHARSASRRPQRAPEPRLRWSKTPTALEAGEPRRAEPRRRLGCGRPEAYLLDDSAPSALERANVK